jgi:spore coat polysaccharide biosynthesis protein SpsF
MLKIVAFLQARMSSKRLPCKVLKEIAGKPILQHICDQLKLIPSLENSIILTSNEISDLPICEYARNNDLNYFCGDLNNVAKRFYDAIESFNPDYFVRINADSPLLHREIIENAIQLLNLSGANFITNINPRSFPVGNSVEVIQSKLYLEHYHNFDLPDDYEHVTPYFYRNQDKIKMQNLKNDFDLSHLKLAVDTEEDFQRVKNIFEKMTKDPVSYSWNEYTKLYLI